MGQTNSNQIDWDGICKEALNGFAVSALPPTLKLPALPTAVTRFTEKAENENVSLKELAAIVETDSGLTVELLKHLNSTFVGLRHKVNSVQQGLSLMGRRQSSMFLITTGMEAAVRSKKSKLINQSCFWNACLQKALFAKEVAKLLHADEETAFAGSLMQDFLLPIVTNDLFDDYIDFIQNRKNQPACLANYEQEKHGWNHALAGACLAHRWHLPGDLVCCILFHHHGLHMLAHPELKRTAVTAVAISALLPDQIRQQFNGLEQLLVLQERWSAFDLESIVNKVDENHEKLGIGVRNDFPLSRRCKPATDRKVDVNDGMLMESVLC